jgi:hypothetical protein
VRGLVALLALFLAGCGSEEAGAPPPAEPATRLTVTVWPQGREQGGEQEWTLECDPAGGTHPSPEAACAALAKSPGALEPVPADAMCTMIFGGPEEARIEGTLDGRAVDASFSRSNGCELARWDDLLAVFDPT